MFGQHKAINTRSLHGGVQHIFRFANGFGASVVRHHYSYGREDSLWELGVIRYESDSDDTWELTYSTPVTDDVMGRLSVEDVAAALDMIESLPREVEAA